MAKHPRILIVDDSYVARRILVRQLNSLGYNEVVEAENGDQAIFKLLESQADKKLFGLIITDLQMPNMTGPDFLRKLAENPDFTKIPKLIASVETDRGTVLNAVLTGADGYILKPTTTDVLKEKLERIFNHGKAAS